MVLAISKGMAVTAVAENTLRKTVLLAEDDPEIRDLLEDILEEQGYDVIPARTGTQALSFLHANAETPPEFVLLDLMMPIVTGWQVLQEMRNDPRLAQVPVIILSGAAQDKPQGANAFLRKPFSIDQLFSVIQSY
jgi:two-component system, chemotaxis family, chemotaxis protein CheY